MSKNRTGGENTTRNQEEDLVFLAQPKPQICEAFHFLPPGACRPLGWMRRHMEEDSQGWIRVTQEMSLEGTWLLPTGPGDLYNTRQGACAPFYHPYIERRHALIGGEYQAHWLDIVLRLGWIAGLEECRKLGKETVEAILATQDADGFLGVIPPEEWLANRDGMDAKFELWGQGETINALLLYHHFTGDQRILTACCRAADWLLDRAGPLCLGASEYQKEQVWDIVIANTMVTLFQKTGKRKYLEMAEFVFQSFIRDHAKEGDWGLILGEQSPEIPVKGHGAGWGLVLLAGLQLCKANGNAQLLHGLRIANDSIMRQHLQPHGAPSGQIEYLAGKGPYLDTELCETFWWSWWWAEMAALTGESTFVDHAEEAAFNAWPASRDRDGRVTAYFHCPNQLLAARYARYDARKYIECCQSNGPRILPILTERMVMTSPDNAVALAFFGPSEASCTLSGNVMVGIRQETDYPFGEDIQITVSSQPTARFPLLLRIPGWCEAAEIRLNDKPIQQPWPAGEWARLERIWSNGDRVHLHLPMSIRVEFWNNQAAFVKRGPLLYALPVAGIKTSLDRWGTFDEVVSPDAAWNYALLLNCRNPAASFKAVALDKPRQSHVWEHPGMALEVPARRILSWTFKDRGAKIPDFMRKLEPGEASIVSPRLPDPPFETTGATEIIRLVPYGFTNLRMTYLPFVWDSPGSP